MYKWRHLVENFFQRLKEFRRNATRDDKTDTSFAAAIYRVSAFLALRRMSTDPRCNRRHSRATGRQTGTFRRMP
jgi:hypothetical protein